MNYPAPAANSKKVFDPVKMKHEAFYDTAKSPYMLRLVISFFASALFYLIMAVNIIIVKSELAGFSEYSGSHKLNFDNLSIGLFLIFGLLILIGDVSSIKELLVTFRSQEVYDSLNTLATMMLIFFIIAFFIRLIPIISGMAIYSKSKYQASMESLQPYWTLLKVFSVAETAVWGLIALMITISIFKNGFSFPNDSVGVMYICIYTMIIVFKILQGIFLLKNVASVKKLALEGEYVNTTTGLTFSSVFICTGFSILLFFILIVQARYDGWSGLIGNFKYYWKLYLFLGSSLLTNGFFASLLIRYNQRMTLAISSATSRLNASAEDSYKTPSERNSTFYTGMTDQQNNGSFYSAQNNQPYSPYQSLQNNSQQFYNSPPQNGGFYSGQNNQPYPPYQSQQNSSQQFYNSPSQNGSFYSGQNNNPPAKPQNGSGNETGSGFSDHSDIFGFK